MKLTVKLETDNAAFDDDFEGEVARVLLQIGSVGSGRLRDINGNWVGEWEYEEA